MSKLFSQLFGAALFTFTIIRTIFPPILLMTWFGGCSAVPLFTKHLPGDRAFIKQFPSEPSDKRLRLAIKDNIDMKGDVTTVGSNFFGLKTTFGLVSIKGVYPLEPKHLDVVGPMGKDIARTVQGMDLLQEGFSGRYATARAAKPTGSSIRVGRLKLQGTDPEVDKAIDDALARAGFQVVQLDDQFRQKWDAAKTDGNTVAAGGTWLSNQGFQLAPGVSARTKAIISLGQGTFTTTYGAAVRRQRAWQQTLHSLFQKIDFISLPTLQKAPPLLPPFNLRLGVLDAHVPQIQNTVPVNFAGNPALAMPVPASHRFRVPVTSLQLVGPPFAEAQLLNAGRIVEEAVKKQ